MEQISTHNF